MKEFVEIRYDNGNDDFETDLNPYSPMHSAQVTDKGKSYVITGIHATQLTTFVFYYNMELGTTEYVTIDDISIEEVAKISRMVRRDEQVRYLKHQSKTRRL